MIDIILDTLLDSIKVLPFLLLAFLLIEAFEHKLSTKSKKAITKANKLGPLWGSLLGMAPQCGFSVMATNLYVTRIISLGTLISIYLTTSDEMILVMLSEQVNIMNIIYILLLKFGIGLFFGFIIDFILRSRKTKQKENYSICDDDNCHCNNNILISAIKHTINTWFFIILTTFILNLAFEYVGVDYLSKILLKDKLFGSFITSLIGLIPTCGASIMITELYLNEAISLGATIAGLLTGSGIALLILFKSNKNIKENLIIVSLVYGIGVFSGIIIEIITRFI